MSSFNFEKIFNSSPLPIYILQDGFFQLVNPEMARMTGYTVEELLKIPYTELVHPEDRPLVVSTGLRRLSGEDVPESYGFRVISLRGEVIHIRGVFSRIEFNHRPAILGQIMDITEQKLAEEALQTSEEKYRKVIENATEGILVAQNGVIKFTNTMLTEITGFSMEEMIPWGTTLEMPCLWQPPYPSRNLFAKAILWPALGVTSLQY